MKTWQNQIRFIYSPDVIFRCNEQFSYGREPVLRRMPDGSLLSLIYTGGYKEPHPENVVAAVQSYDDGKTWSEPRVLFSHPERACWGSELFTEGAKPELFFMTYLPDTLWNEIRAFISTTDDSGRTWSEPRSVPGVPPNFIVRQGKVLHDGSRIIPVYWLEQKHAWKIPNYRDGAIGEATCGFLRSENDGKSYSLHGYLQGAWLNEPEVIETSPGNLLAFLRSKAGVLMKSSSRDSGRTWSPPEKTAIPNPGSKIVLYRVRDAIVLLNNVCPLDANAPKWRNRMELWVSRDACRSWCKKLLLAEIPDYVPNPYFWIDREHVPMISYPHGFADDEKELLYVALDAVFEFYLLKIPYADILN